MPKMMAAMSRTRLAQPGLPVPSVLARVQGLGFTVGVLRYRYM